MESALSFMSKLYFLNGVTKQRYEFCQHLSIIQKLYNFGWIFSKNPLAYRSFMTKAANIRKTIHQDKLSDPLQ